jgi:hypothetical protein
MKIHKTHFDHLDQMEIVEIRAAIITSVINGCPQRKSMKTSWTHFGKSPLPNALCKNRLMNLRGTG